MRESIAIALLTRLERALYRAAARIVTVGESYRQRLIEHGADADRISVVMNGVDRDVFAPRQADAELAARLGVGGRFVVAYCGVVGMAHALEVVVRAAALLRDRGAADVAFLIVGDGARLDALRRMAAEQGLDNVVFAGYVARRREVAAMLAVADACLVHLRAEQLFATVMPSKIFEAAAMERPVILGVQGVAAEFVADAGCGLCIEPENETELADAVLRLASDAQLRGRLGAAGRDYVARHFDRAQLAERYARILEGAEAGGGTGEP